MDTNVLLAAVEATNPWCAKARAFLDSLATREDVAISEFVLAELYVLVRNPAVVGKPLTAADAASLCQTFRRHPRWRLLGFPGDSLRLHEALWRHAAARTFARRRLYDVRLALSLTMQGVKTFATANPKDFRDMGFARLLNPFDEE